MRCKNITPRIDMGCHFAPIVQKHQEVQVKKIGILGGMSAASTQIYYQTLCLLTQSELGGLHSPNLLIRSVDFAPLAQHMNDGNWAAIGDVLHAEAKLLAAGGAELIVLATNTMHKLKDQIMQDIDLPFIHIAEATAAAVLAGGSACPAFFATKFTMQEAFYLDILRDNGLDPIVPNITEQDTINDIIFDELCKNIATPESEAAYLDILKGLKAQGADSVILGCTEVCLLLNAHNTGLPVYDTTQIHCQAAIRAALDKRSFIPTQSCQEVSM